MFLLDPVPSCLPLHWLPPSCIFSSCSKKPSSRHLQTSSNYSLIWNFPCAFCFLKYFCFHSQSRFWNKSPTNSLGNLSIALQHFPQVTHLKLNPDILIVELNYLSHFSPVSVALNIVSLSSFLKCFPLLVFIMSDSFFHICLVWASVAFSFSRGLILPSQLSFLPFTLFLSGVIPPCYPPLCG